MAKQYLELVSEDVDALVALHERVHGVSFGAPDPHLGQARVARCADGSLIAIRRPLAAHEQPIVRSYLAVDDIDRAVRDAVTVGAVTVWGPERLGPWGAFAILFHGQLQLALWQAPP